MEVAAVSSPTPRTRSILFGGPELAGFTLKPDVLAPHVGLVVPSPYGSGMAPPRIYSVRRFDAAAPTLEVTIALHGGAGIASAWAARARPGDRVGISVAGGLPMKPASRYVVAGDHTAVGAIAHLLDRLPGTASAEVFIEVPDPAERQDLPSAAATAITWFHRDETSPPEASRLPEAVMAATAATPDGLALWAGAEHHIATRIRTHVRRTLRLPREAHSVVAYWKASASQGSYRHYD
ncbi:siderophore-interacting protein [Azospirillum thermophilum]|uniref:Siderophore-interacting protein n=1 Tax=Azospirillum thermophilum TaxID=2202148 RepID=A0A2S2CVX7_9PROT|nr:siderophore-interacting protein [Azospirillum thermophilum]